VQVTFASRSPATCYPHGILYHIHAKTLLYLYSAAVTTLSDTARTYSDYSGPRGGVAA